MGSNFKEYAVRPSVVALLSALCSAGLGVSINFATEQNANLLSWIAVATMTLSSAATAILATHLNSEISDPGQTPSNVKSFDSRIAMSRGGALFGAIISILLVVVLATGCLAPQANNEATTSGDNSPINQGNNEGDINGICNNQGTGGTVNCQIESLPAQIGDVKVAADAEYGAWLVNGDATHLPQPPDYPDSDALFHCPNWLDWIMKQPNIYALKPSGLISLQASMTDQVSIVNVRTVVQSRKPLAGEPTSFIQCNWGAGSDMGYEVRNDTVLRKSILIDHKAADPTPAPMPPASVQMDPNTAFDVVINLDSAPGFLYTGRILITAIINGERKELSIGTPENPYKWATASDALLNNLPADQIFDWSKKSTEWVVPTGPPYNGDHDS